MLQNASHELDIDIKNVVGSGMHINDQNLLCIACQHCNPISQHVDRRQEHATYTHGAEVCAIIVLMLPCDRLQFLPNHKGATLRCPQGPSAKLA